MSQLRAMRDCFCNWAIHKTNVSYERNPCYIRLEMSSRVDPLTISWQDSYYDLTKIIHYSKMVSYHDGQNSQVIKNTITSVQAAETQSRDSFHPTTTVSTRFHHQNASTC